MSEQDLKDFFEENKDDDSLNEKWSEAGSTEKQAEIAREAGYDVEAGDIESFREGVKDKAVGSAEGDELSEEQLENVAGGITSELFKLTMTMASNKVSEDGSFADELAWDTGKGIAYAVELNTDGTQRAVNEFRSNYVRRHGDDPSRSTVAQWLVNDYNNPLK